MKILFLTTRKPDKQGDFLEMMVFDGMRSLLGEDFVDYPKKKIMYGDFSESPKESLHGKGFTLLSKPFGEISYDRDRMKLKDFDVVLVGDGHIYGDHWEVDHPNVWY